MTKAVSFQYEFTVSIKNGKLDLESLPKYIGELSLGFVDHFIDYLGRKKFAFDSTIYDYGSEGFPVASFSIESVKATANSIDFVLGTTAVPLKLLTKHRKMLETSIESHLNDEKFKIWWDSDPRGPRNRPLEDKRKIFEEVTKIPNYDGSSELKLEDLEITLEDALEFLGFTKNIKAKELKKSFKTKYRELQLKYHPDSESGNQDKFMYLQNCREVVEGWMKRG